MKALAPKVVTGRLGRPEEIADAAIFFASVDATSLLVPTCLWRRSTGLIRPSLFYIEQIEETEKLYG
jgi:hypothetical protein